MKCFPWVFFFDLRNRHSLSPQQDFFELMTHGKWCVADPSAVMVAAGKPFEAVILLHQGTASAYVGGTASPGDKVRMKRAYY